MIRIVLVAPQIPQNTGSIGRLCAGLNIPLLLVEPLGFELSDRYLKRAGLDYWPHIQLTVYPRLQDVWDEFPASTPWLLSARAQRSFWDVQFGPDDLLVFGQETKGLPAAAKDRWPERLITVPHNDNIRSLNLANTVSVVTYEALRQLR
jgi:tRNA (cytidine/uridine-2'-O-)-methyltransferase